MRKLWKTIAALGVVTGLVVSILELSCHFLGQFCSSYKRSSTADEPGKPISATHVVTGIPRVELLKEQGFFSCHTRIVFFSANGSTVPPQDVRLGACPALGETTQRYKNLNDSMLILRDLLHLSSDGRYAYFFHDSKLLSKDATFRTFYNASFIFYIALGPNGLVREFKFRCGSGTGVLTNLLLGVEKKEIIFDFDGSCEDALEVNDYRIRTAERFQKGLYLADPVVSAFYDCGQLSRDCRNVQRAAGRYKIRLNNDFTIDFMERI